MIVAIDVHYRESGAKVVAIGFADWTDADTGVVKTAWIDDIHAYIPGQFYKRELPCLLHILAQFDLTTVTHIIVDGNVFLDDQEQPGLGKYLFDALDALIPVIGIAKTLYNGGNRHIETLRRGASRKPLYISAIGMSLSGAIARIKQMYGNNRIPTLLKKLDRLTKSDE
jgi:deoxyribonuclease V